MSHNKLHSSFMSVIQDEVFIRSELYKFGINAINIKDIIYKFEYTQHDRVSNYKNNMMENRNCHQISRWDSSLLCFSLGHQSYIDWEIKYACCDRIMLNFS